MPPNACGPIKGIDEYRLTHTSKGADIETTTCDHHINRPQLP